MSQPEPELVKSAINDPLRRGGVKECWAVSDKGDESYVVAVFHLEDGQDPAQWAAAWNYMTAAGYQWQVLRGLLVGLPKGKPVPAWLETHAGPPL